MLPSRSVQSRLRVHVSPCAGVRLVQQSAVTLFARSREARASSLLRVHFSSKQSLARAAGGFALLRFQAPRRDPSVQGRGGGIRGRSEVSAGVCRPKQGRASRCGVALLQRERPPPTSTASSPSRLLVFFLPLSLPRLSPDPAHFWGPFPPQPLGT